MALYNFKEFLAPDYHIENDDMHGHHYELHHCMAAVTKQYVDYKHRISVTKKPKDVDGKR